MISRPGGSTWPAAATLLLLVAPWLMLCQRLSTYWTLDAAYAYAWSVPVLAALLALRRWNDTPFALREPSALHPVFIGFGGIFIGVRFLHEASPDWSVLNWALALGASALTATLLLSLSGGKAAQSFIWPTLLLLTVVPWPQRFELAVAHLLMQGLASTAAELVSLCGLPAVASGHLIRLPAGVLGVDEACSGLRSLQSVIMAALFLGELSRLSTGGRIRLLGIGFAVALAANLLRTTLLALLAGRLGLEALAQWHDTIGWAELALILSAQWVAAQRLATSIPAVAKSAPVPFHPLRPAAAVLCVAGLALSEVTVQLWYGAGPRPSPSAGWSVRWPSATVGYAPLSLPPHAQRLLLCDQAEGGTWTSPDGTRWIAYALEWSPSRTAPQLARMHRPESCLQANGAVLQDDLGLLSVPVGSRTLAFHHFTFLKGGTPMHVFYCLDDANSPSTPTGTWAGVWHRARAGLRNLGQRSLEVALVGDVPAPEAAAAFLALTRSLILPH